MKKIPNRPEPKSSNVAGKGTGMAVRVQLPLANVILYAATAVLPVYK